MAGTHLASWVAWLVVALLGRAAADLGGSAAWGGVVVVPALVAYGPWVFVFVPSQASGFRQHRADLGELGASAQTGRAMFWTGAPFAILGLSLAIGAFFACFVR